MAAPPKTTDPALPDDLPLEPLAQAIEAQLRLWEQSGDRSPLRFGPAEVSRADYAMALKSLVIQARNGAGPQAFFDRVRGYFDFYAVYGPTDSDGSWGDVFITSYYEPVIPGSRKPTAIYTQPLYRRPDDLITLDLEAFDPKFAEERKLRGRLRDGALIPYYMRAEIESGALSKRGLEICWVDPVDAFTLQIQGSGTVEFVGESKSLRVGYADRNGHKYESIGKFLTDIIPIEEMTLLKIESHLRALNDEDRQALMSKNPSYVFFRELDSNAVTTLGVAATPGRTIATDARWFPKGALAFLSARKPVFSEESPEVPVGWEPFSRFVLDQDTGGAIVGTGRVDLFWGRGEEAKRSASGFKERGKLYYLVPKMLSKKPGN